MDNLRLILIIIGLLILAAIVVFHRVGSGGSRQHASRREPRIGGAGESGDADSGGEAAEPAVEQPRLDKLDESPSESATRREPVFDRFTGAQSPRPAGDESANKIVLIYLRSRGDKPITGVELLDAAVKAGLTFGEMNIFHRRQEGGEQPVFSMANLVNPGHFDPTAWNLFETRGLTLFMTLPGPLSALDAWDAMLATGRRLSELLDADLLDDGQCLITRQRVAQIREDMRDYDRRMGLVGH